MEARMSPARAPEPPEGSFDPAAAARGRAVFEGRAACATYHVPPLFSEPGWPMHTAAEIGIDDFQASRAPDRRYRTTPLRGLFARSKGGFHHDGRFPDLRAVVDHYDRFPRLGLAEQDKRDLIELRITELGRRAMALGRRSRRRGRRAWLHAAVDRQALDVAAVAAGSGPIHQPPTPVLAQRACGSGGAAIPLGRP
jgi:hypothetical protein